MNLCVCGWYYNDEWYASLLRLHQKGVANVYIVAHREHPLLELSGLPYTMRENTGLEWGAYNYYLEKIWAGGLTVYAHDDAMFRPVVTSDMRVVSGEDLFHRLDNPGIDHAYVFSDRAEDVINYGQHGRMVVMNGPLQEWAKARGIWHDRDNSQHVNSGIGKFAELMKEAGTAGFDVNHKIYFPGLQFGVRGQFKGREIR